MGGSSSVPEVPEVPEDFSVPLSKAPQFLVNQKGFLCTLTEERFIFTKIQNAPILVALHSNLSILECIKNEIPALNLSLVGSVPVHVLWDENKSTLLHNLPDENEVCFDAVVFPKTNYYQAILVWRGKKPERAAAMLSGQYLITSEFETQACSLSFNNEPGLVEFSLGNCTNIAALSKDYCFKDGKRKYQDNLDLKLGESKVLIYEAVTTFGAKYTASTKYVCGCLWEGEKPSNNSFAAIDVKENKVYEYDESKAVFKKPKTLVYLLNNVQGIIKRDIHELCIEFPSLNMTLPCSLDVVLNGKRITKLSKLRLPCNVYVTMYQISHQRVYSCSWRVLHATCVTYQNTEADDSLQEDCHGTANEDILEEKKLHVCD